MTLLAQDKNGNAIQAATLKQDGAHTLSLTATSARITGTLDSDSKITAIWATVPFHIAYGDDETVATTADACLPAGQLMVFATNGKSKIAALRAGSTDGTLYINELV